MSRRSPFVLLFCLTLACSPADPEGDPGSGGRGGSTGSAGVGGTMVAAGGGGSPGAAGRGGTTGDAGAAGTTGAAGRGGTTVVAGTGGTTGAAGAAGTSGAAGAAGTGGSGAAGRGGTTGTAGRGGTTGTAGQGGTSGTAGTGGSGQGGAGGKSQTCLDIEAEYARMLPRFLMCSGSQRCDNRASSAPGCVCQLAVQEQSPLELETLLNVELRWHDERCTNPICNMPCPPVPAPSANACQNGRCGG